ncbi:MAG TPA: histidinol-phosphate transaminase [Acidimicrobiia bacterium]|nr:histidinol-phosphate transaminase [Acidimicrobiia bacterium]
MPNFRADIREISPYLPGRSVAEIAREHGFDPDDIVKLASNESAVPPLEAVQAVIREGAGSVHRYPDNDAVELRRALATNLGVDEASVWMGGGSSELLRVIALGMGGPGTSAVYAWPSFVIYRLASVLAMSHRVEVPLANQRHDLDAMADAIGDDTTVVYVCNPNNPTGTHVTASEISRFVEAVPERVLVVIDEAYHEYVTAPDHATAIPLALERPNVVVTRTFSKIHGLAALRAGYAVARPETVTELRKAQAPFTVSTLAQLAALESLRHPAELQARMERNATERSRIERSLAELGVGHVPSQGNFVFVDASSLEDPATAYLRHGLIVRVFGQWVRVTVGEPDENDRFLGAVTALHP